MWLEGFAILTLLLRRQGDAGTHRERGKERERGRVDDVVARQHRGSHLAIVYNSCASSCMDSEVLKRTGISKLEPITPPCFSFPSACKSGVTGNSRAHTNMNLSVGDRLTITLGCSHKSLILTNIINLTINIKLKCSPPSAQSMLERAPRSF